MNISFPSPEFDRVVAAVCHGTATDAEMVALNQLLRAEPRARDEYLLQVELHSRLASNPDLFSPPESLAVTQEPGTIVTNDCPGLFASMPIGGKGQRKWAATLAVAACVALLAVGAWSLWLRGPTTPTGSTSSAVAMLTRTVEARWVTNASRQRIGGALDPGWLRLESGLAQVVFYSGSRVVIEGPAELRLVSPNEAFLKDGRLLAEVPTPARGFHLNTEEVEITDLGTSFGAEVAGGHTEVHVFNGEVELRTKAGQTQTLTETQAIRIQEEVPPLRLAAHEAGFRSMFEFQKQSSASEALRYEQWQFTTAQRVEDPCLVVYLDFENFSTAVWLLRNTAVNGGAAPEAIIVGCSRAEGRWREKQALEFQTVNDRVRLVVPGEFDSVTFSLWVCVMGLDRQFNSLFMCDGFAPGTVHWLIRHDGVLGVTVFGHGPGNFQILASPPVIGLDQIGRWSHLAVVLNGQDRQVVHYLNGSPVSRHRLKLGLPFRIGAAELGNWNAQSGPNPAPALIRNLSGSLDEFSLFNRALTEAEVRELYLEGKP